MSDYTSFTVTTEGGVAELVLGNAAKMNALGPSFWQELPQAVAKLNQEGTVRALIISSTGSLFCSGIDLTMFANPSLTSVAAPAERERLKHLILQLQASLTCLQDCRFPVIAAVQGACLGAGLDLISACDLRYGTTDSFYVVQEINIGIMADLGSLQRLPRLLPDAVVRELCFTGAKLSAERAYNLGFLNATAQTHEEVLAAARQAANLIAQRSPLPIAASKDVLNYSANHTESDALNYCATVQSAIFEPAEVMAQVMAMKNKTRHESKDLLAMKAI
ncbi:MAG: enoyl-CoA hydratase/isomerase family protein [Cyanobacteria bacterium REEB67]|nr:enoyl-CoA hydratase/isomerase family protein [Cyanobacteria bacterium REEB67]